MKRLCSEKGVSVKRGNCLSSHSFGRERIVQRSQALYLCRDLDHPLGHLPLASGVRANHSVKQRHHTHTLEPSGPLPTGQAGSWVGHPSTVAQPRSWYEMGVDLVLAFLQERIRLPREVGAWSLSFCMLPRPPSPCSFFPSHFNNAPKKHRTGCLHLRGGILESELLSSTIQRVPHLAVFLGKPLDLVPLFQNCGRGWM